VRYETSMHAKGGFSCVILLLKTKSSKLVFAQKKQRRECF